MTLAELVSILRASGYPVAYSQFNGDPPSIPFITYLTAVTTNFYADNKTYQKIDNPDVELYTNMKDLEAEQRLESLFDDNDIPYEVTETYINDERLFQRIYEIGVILNG